MYDDIDIKATKENARSLLAKYRRYSRNYKFKQLAEAIMCAINKCDEMEREILYKKYVNYNGNYCIKIYIEMNVSESTFYRHLESALLQFAEAYNQGELLVYKDGLEHVG